MYLCMFEYDATYKNLNFVSMSSSLVIFAKNFKKGCGVKEFGNLGPLYTKPKAHTKEEEMPKDKRRKSRLLRNIAEDNPVLGQPRS